MANDTQCDNKLSAPSIHDNTITIYGGMETGQGVAVMLNSGLEDTAGNRSSLLLNFGADEGFSGYNEMFHSGLSPLIIRGVIPPVPGVFDKRIPNRGTLDVIQREWHRMNGRFRSSKEIEDLMQGARFQGNVSRTLAAILLTNFQRDKVGNAGVIDHKVPLVGSQATHQILHAEETIRNVPWLREITHFKDRSKEQYGGELTRFNREFVYATSRAALQLGDFNVIPHSVSYSAVGSLAYDIMFPDGKRVHYTGDIQYGAETKYYLDWLRQQKEIDVLMVDASNADRNPQNQESGSTVMTESGFSEMLRTRLGIRGGSFFIVSPQRQFERWNNILEAAQSEGLDVYIPLSAAYYLDCLQGTNDPRIPQLDQFKIYLEPIRSGSYSKLDYDRSLRPLLDRDNIVTLEQMKETTDEKKVVLFTATSQVANFRSKLLFPYGGHLIVTESESREGTSGVFSFELQKMIDLGDYSYTNVFIYNHLNDRQLRKFVGDIIRETKVNTIIPMNTSRPEAVKGIVEAISECVPEVLTKVPRGLPVKL